MNKIAKFYKVSFEQFLKDWIKCYPSFDVDNEAAINMIKDIYDKIQIPKRSTIGSAGYDFVTPNAIVLNPGSDITIPTGIRCQMNQDWVLMIYPRSGLGFKYQLSLANTTGIIDSDYVWAENEGHIIIKIVNRGNKVFTCDSMTRIVQGVFIPYGVTIDDDAEGERRGGFGSTGE